MTRRLLALATLLSAPACVSGMQPGQPAVQDQVPGDVRRMPAEWEPQAAVWLQWPHAYEGAQVERAFANIARNIADFEDVHLVVTDATMQARAEQVLDGVPVTFHVWATDSSWMRDNGPRYLEVDGQLVVQNWGFDAWGGGFGPVPYDNDTVIPDRVAAELDLPLEQVALVHERGDLEVNGSDTAIVSWSVLSHRNPNLGRDEMTAALQQALGVESVVYTEGFDRWDGTRGHVDGMLRFVSHDTVLIGQDGSALLDDVADQIAAQRPDLTLVRLESEHATLFMNYLVGDGFVLFGDSGDDAENAKAAQALAAFFPDRQARFVNVDALWANGGGIHCVTNDQPEG